MSSSRPKTLPLSARKWIWKWTRRSVRSNLWGTHEICPKPEGRIPKMDGLEVRAGQRNPIGRKTEETWVDRGVADRW